MRLAEAELTQATFYARAGEVDQVMAKAGDAFGRARRPLPSILLVGHEVAGVMQRTRPDTLRPLTSPSTSEPLRLWPEPLGGCPCRVIRQLMGDVSSPPDVGHLG